MINRFQLFHSTVIRHSYTVKAHLTAQQITQNCLTACRDLPINGSIGVHYAVKFSICNGCLKRLGINFTQFTRGNDCLCRMDSTLSCHKPKKMFAAGTHTMFILQAFHIGCPHRSGKGRVLTVGFSHTTKARVTADIEHRSQRMTDSHSASLSGNAGCHFLLLLRVPCGSLPQPAGKRSRRCHHHTR